MAFIVGIILGQHTQKIQHIYSPFSFHTRTSCTNGTLCQAAAISFYAKNLTEAKSAGLQNKPLGYCLQVPVLLYHHIQPEEVATQKGQTSLTVDNNVFDSQMAYLTGNGYVTLSADQLIHAITTHSPLPAKSVVVTMDDGYADNYVYAYPIIQKYHVVLNLMVPTGLLGGVSGTNSYYTWDQLKEMTNSGLVFAYNHTWSHYPLAAGPLDKDTFEVKTAQDQLQQHLGKASPIFVYPYGSGAGVGWVVNVLKSQGFVAAFSTFYGRYQCDSNLLSLPRIHIGNAPLSTYGI